MAGCGEPGETLVVQWPLTLALLLLLYPFNRLSFFVVAELRPGAISDVASSLEAVLIWTAALLLGPVGLGWGNLRVPVGDSCGASKCNRAMDAVRNELLSLIETTLLAWAGCGVPGFGGWIPFPGLYLPLVIWPAAGYAGTLLVGPALEHAVSAADAVPAALIDGRIRPLRFLRFSS
jgi:hypothetical protein